MNRLRLVLLGACASAALQAQASTLAPLSYSMINGGGQSSGGSFNYWDAGYTGSGATTTDGAFLSGGLGKLTDGVFATQRWDAVSNLAGTGEYVGWRAGLQTNPVITFNFAAGTVINEIEIYLDNSQFGGVFAPATVAIDGQTYSLPVATGNGIRLGFAALNLTGPSHTIQLNQAGDSWVFVSEITFDGTTSAVPEPRAPLLGLAGLALVGAVAARRRRVGR